MNNRGFLLVDIMLALAMGTAIITGMTLLLAQARNSELALVQLRTVREQNKARGFEWWRGKDLYAPPMAGWQQGDSLSLLTSCVGVLSVSEQSSVGGRMVGDTWATVLVDSAERMRLGADCGYRGLPGGSTHVQQVGILSLGSRVLAHGVDCVLRDGVVYAFVAATSANVADPDLFVVDITNAESPVLVSSLDMGSGLFSLDAYDLTVFGGRDSGSLQVVLVRVEDVRHPTVDKQITLPSVTGSFPEARTTVAYDGVLYVGTYETAGSEFHILRGTNGNPFGVAASVAVNHSLRAFLPYRSRVNNQARQLLYIASSGNAEEVLIFDVTDAAHPVQVGSLDLNGTGNATAFALVGSELLVGRQQVSGQSTVDVVDVRDPFHPKIGSSALLSVRSGSVVNGLVYSNHRVIFTTTDTAKPVWTCEYDNAQVRACESTGGYPNVGRIDVCNGYVAVPTQHALALLKME